MPSLGIIAHNNGMILRAYKSDEEEAVYAVLGPIPSSQPKVMVDLGNNRVFEELINVNELHLAKEEMYFIVEEMRMARGESSQN